MIGILSKIHIAIGLISIAVFLYTGSDMRRIIKEGDKAHKEAGVTVEKRLELVEERSGMRANHVYIMFTALINLALGLYLTDHKETWRRIARILGSVVVILGNPVLIATYFMEDKTSVDRPIMTFTVIFIFSAVMLHGVSRLAEDPEPETVPQPAN